MNIIFPPESHVLEQEDQGDQAPHEVEVVDVAGELCFPPLAVEGGRWFPSLAVEGGRCFPSLVGVAVDPPSLRAERRSRN